MYDIAYAEIQGLSTESCYKPIFDEAVNQINFILNNGGCVKDESTSTPVVRPSVAVPAGETQMWGINNGDAIWTRAGSAGAWQSGGGALRYLDRLPQSNGGLIWGVNSAQNIYYKDGINGGWVYVSGALVFLRISAFDKTVWGINQNYQVYSLIPSDVSKAAWYNYPGIKLKYLDVSPKDGSVYGISTDYRLYISAGAGQSWNEAVGMKVRFLRVISNGNVFAIGQSDRKVYFKNTQSDSWVVLDGESGFVFIDVSNNGHVYAIKSDGTTYFHDYVEGSWVNCNMKLSTLRVLDDGSVWGLSYKDYGDQYNSLIYFRQSSTSGWTNIAGGLVTLWGPYNVDAGDSHLWGLNGGDAIWTRISKDGTWVNIGGGLHYIDRLPSIRGGVIWGINSAQNIYYRKSINDAWVYVAGALTFLRISPFDRTVWGINQYQQVYYLRPEDVSTASWNNEASVAFYYLDISPLDGSVYGISNDHTLWMKASLDSSWEEVSGLSVSFVRVNALGTLIAIEYQTGNLYYRQASSTNWKVLDSEGGFAYVDINSFNVIYAIKNDRTTWYRSSLTSSWVNTNMKLKTLRVLEDGGAWGLSWRDYGDSVNSLIYYKQDNSTAWTNVAGGLDSLWGPSNLFAGDHQVWGLNNADAIWIRHDPSSSGAWQNIGGGLRYLDRLSTPNGGLIWGINSAQAIYYRDGVYGSWVNVAGALVFLRISAYDRTIWGINKNQQVYSLVVKDVSKAAWQNVQNLALKYLDVSPKDGSVYGISSDHYIWSSAGVGSSWSVVSGLQARHLKVSAAGTVYVVDQSEGKIYLKKTGSDTWESLDGSESQFVFIDVNSRGALYAIKSDASTWHFNQTTNAWWNCGIKLKTLRVLESGDVWGLSWRDYGDQYNSKIYYKESSSQSNWQTVTGGLASLWGPYNTYSGDSQLWGLNGGDAIYTRAGVDGTWVNVGGALRYLDRLESFRGGYVWGINSAKSIYYINGVDGSWVSVSGSLIYLRVSRFDKTVWGINSYHQVYYILEKDFSTSGWVNVPNAIFYYLDVSPLDGSVYGISHDHRLWRAAKAGDSFQELTGLNVSFVRVNALGNVLGVQYSTGKVYFKSSYDADWEALDSTTGFSFVDINNFGVIYGIKNDMTTWYKSSPSSSWVDTSLKLKTLRVLEDGGAWGLAWRDYGDNINGKIYYKKDSSTAWSNVAGGLVSLWGPYNLFAGDHQVWGLNSGDAIYTRYDPSSSGVWQNIGGGLRYLDRLPTPNGGLIWGINSGQAIYYRSGVDGAWVAVSGALKYLRISPYDRTVWGINKSYQVYYLTLSAVATSAWVNVASITLKYLDVDPSDGSVFGIDQSNNLWRTAGAGEVWNQTTSTLTVKFLRVLTNNKIVAVGTDGKVYVSPTSSLQWTALSGQDSFVFVDGNVDVVYGIKSDGSSWYNDFTNGWVSAGKTLSTLRVLESGAVWAIGTNQAIYYRQDSSSSWTTVAGALVSLWGPTNYAYF